MVLWIPVVLFAIGAIVAFLVSSRDDASAGGFMVFLFALMTFGPISVIGYGGYIWLRKGYWGSVSIYDLLTIIIGPGQNLNSLLERTSWEGIQKICDGYLESSVGWTLLFVPMAVLWLLFHVSEAVDKHRRETRAASPKQS